MCNDKYKSLGIIHCDVIIWSVGKQNKLKRNYLYKMMLIKFEEVYLYLYLSKIIKDLLQLEH